MSAAPTNPWDQCEGETAEAFVHFAFFLALGPTRSMDAAYVAFKATRKKKADSAAKRHTAPGSWWRESRTFCWRDRAAAHDLHHLRERGREAVVSYVAALRLAAQRTAEALADPACRPADWRDAVEGLKALGGLIPAELLTELGRQPSP